MPNIIRTVHVEVPSGHISIMQPEGVLKGTFLHYISSAGYPVMAEGIVPLPAEIRDRGSQNAVSGRFNNIAKNIVHGSHLIPRNLGGSGEAYNLLALPKEFNTGQMRDFERHLEAETKTSERYLQVFARYSGSQQIPTGVIYRVFDVVNGKPQRMLLEKQFFILH